MTSIPVTRPTFPRSLPHHLVALLTLNLIPVLLLSLIQPLVVTLSPTLPSATTSALPYARADSNVFIENRGQFASEFVAMLLGQEARLAVGRDGRLHLHVDGAPPLTLTFTATGITTAPDVSLHGPLATTISFLTGNDPGRWQANVPVWEAVRLGLAPGVTLELKVIEGRLRLHARTADPALLNRVQMQVSGGEVIGVVDGELEVQAGDRRLRLPLLEAVTPAGIPHRYAITPAIAPDGVVRAPFGVPEKMSIAGQATPTQTSSAMLLGASTFLGGPLGDPFAVPIGDDFANAIVIDGQGAVYVAGSTVSVTFPTTPGAYDGALSGSSDAFVSKLSSDLGSLLASTFLGGSGGDSASALALDAQGNVYVAGGTGSADFPTAGAYDGSYNGNGDAFVSKLSSDLGSLLASTFLGGSNNDSADTLKLDAQGNVYIAGLAGYGFPTTPGAYDLTFNGGFYDAFVSKLNGNLTFLLASTFLGGNGDYERATTLTVDGHGDVYVAGWTYSANFPSTLGSYDTSFNGGDVDAFVSKLKGDLTSLFASTFLGGTDADYAYALVHDAQGSVYVTGLTWSNNFPTVLGAYDRWHGGYDDVFVSKLNGNLSNLIVSTFLGGSIRDSAFTLALDSQGNVYVAGSTLSSDFPVTPEAYDTTHNSIFKSDAFVSKLNGNLSTMLFSTFLGGSDGDRTNALALDARGNVYVAGETASADFPTTAGAYDGSYNSSVDAFVSKLTFRHFVYLPLTVR